MMTALESGGRCTNSAAKEDAEEYLKCAYLRGQKDHFEIQLILIVALMIALAVILAVLILMACNRIQFVSRNDQKQTMMNLQMMANFDRNRIDPRKVAFLKDFHESIGLDMSDTAYPSAGGSRRWDKV